MLRTVLLCLSVLCNWPHCCKQRMELAQRYVAALCRHEACVTVPSVCKALLTEQPVVEKLAKSVHQLRNDVGEDISDEFVWRALQRQLSMRSFATSTYLFSCCSFLL